MKHPLSRRQIIKGLGLGILASSLPTGLLCAAANSILNKPIPKSGEMLPVIGMGTWRTFNVGNDPRLLRMRTDVLRAFFAQGGGLIDSSPMYGSAPDTMGYALKRLGVPDTLFSAEKVWSPAGGTAKEQVADLSRRWGVESFDLIQVHNLTDWQAHLAALQEMKTNGKIRYVGITTSHGRRHGDFEKIMASEDIDFVQLTYNMTHRTVEQRLLPLALEKGIAVIANRPYDGGYLAKRLKQKEEVPEWAMREFNCRNWADFLLRFIVSHPAVNCAIPATSKVKHMNENMQAGQGPMPSAALRRRMISHLESL